MDREERPEPTGAEDPGVSPAAQATGWQPRTEYLEALVDMGIPVAIAEKVKMCKIKKVSKSIHYKLHPDILYFCVTRYCLLLIRRQMLNQF